MRNVTSRNGVTLVFPHVIRNFNEDIELIGDLRVVKEADIYFIQMPSDRLAVGDEVEIILNDLRMKANVVSLSEPREAKGDWSAYPEMPECVTGRIVATSADDGKKIVEIP